MHAYVERLREAYAAKGSMLCFGMDPVVERMGLEPRGDLADGIVGFFTGILEGIKGKVTAVKPNVAFYLQYGADGTRALFELAARVRVLGIPLVIDAKNADIGKTSEAYARHVFDVLAGDAVTLNPYMGEDSLEPFFARPGKGSYVLALTSNPGAGDFQTAPMRDGRPLYEHVLERICDWNGRHGSVGAVLGATQSRFRGCLEQLARSGRPVPLLVPGVGAQGGSYRDVEAALEASGYDKGIVRINASSSISYARDRWPSLTREEAAFKAVEELLGG